MADTGSYDNIISGLSTIVGGAIDLAPLGTPLPTSIDDFNDLDDAFEPFSILGDEGITISFNRTVVEEKDEAGRTVNTIVSERSISVAASFREFLNGKALQAVWGADKVTLTAANDEHGNQIAAHYDGSIVPKCVAVIRIKDGNKRGMFVVPVFGFTETGEIKLAATESIKPSVVATGYPAASGDLLHFYGDDGLVTVTP